MWGVRTERELEKETGRTTNSSRSWAAKDMREKGVAGS